VQAYTLYSSVRPFGVTAILGGWDSEAELGVDGQVGSGPTTGGGGRVENAAIKKGGPGLYMIEPSGLYWVRKLLLLFALILTVAGILRCRHWQRTTGCQS
jgi:20S proteasome alpha/beta subunit